MKYFICDEKTPSSYTDVLDFVCSVCSTANPDRYYWSAPIKIKFEAERFTKNYRHNNNDGTWSSYRWQYKYDWIRIVDEETGQWRYVKEKVDQTLIPPQHTPKKYQIRDEYNRILNSKDLIRDALKHDYDPKRAIKARRKAYLAKRGDFNWYSYARNQRGRNWQKYLGKHESPLAVKKGFVYAEQDQKETLEEFGTTFKLRRKRRSEFRDLWDFGGDGWLEKGWKQTRKKKQWM